MSNKPESEKRVEALTHLSTYLALMPVGEYDESLILRPGYRKLRLDLYHERGCSCEACGSSLTDDDFELHHTNYLEGNNPQFLKILCSQCHTFVNRLSAVFRDFEYMMSIRGVNPEIFPPIAEITGTFATPSAPI